MLDTLLSSWQLLLPPHPRPLCPTLVLHPARSNSPDVCGAGALRPLRGLGLYPVGLSDLAAEPDPLHLALLAGPVLSLSLRSCGLPQPKREGSSRGSPGTDRSHVGAAAWGARCAAGRVFAKCLSQQRPRFCCAWQGKENNRKKSLNPISGHGSPWPAWKLSFVALSE